MPFLATTTKSPQHPLPQFQYCGNFSHVLLHVSCAAVTRISSTPLPPISMLCSPNCCQHNRRRCSCRCCWWWSSRYICRQHWNGGAGGRWSYSCFSRLFIPCMDYICVEFLQTCAQDVAFFVESPDISCPCWMATEGFHKDFIRTSEGLQKDFGFSHETRLR